MNAGAHREPTYVSGGRSTLAGSGRGSGTENLYNALISFLEVGKAKLRPSLGWQSCAHGVLASKL